jgi:hypothetical protein
MKETKMWMVFEDEVQSFLNTLDMDRRFIAEAWFKALFKWIDKNDAEAKERLKNE